VIACASALALCACGGDDTSTSLSADSASPEDVTTDAPFSQLEATPNNDASSPADATTEEARGGDASDDSRADGPDSTVEDADSAAADSGNSESVDAADAVSDDADSSGDAVDVGAVDARDATYELDATDAGIEDAATAHDSAQDSADSAVAEADAVSPFDASGLDAAVLCDPFPFNAPQIPITYVDAAAPSPSTFIGGTIESGTYWLTSITSYQGAFGNSWSTAEVLIVDAFKGTMRNAYADNAPPATYRGFGYLRGPAQNALSLFLLCPGNNASATFYYSFSGTGPGAQLTWSYGDDVSILTKQ
jgi:hypothetical protein